MTISNLTPTHKMQHGTLTATDACQESSLLVFTSLLRWLQLMSSYPEFTPLLTLTTPPLTQLTGYQEVHNLAHHHPLHWDCGGTRRQTLATLPSLYRGRRQEPLTV